MRLLFFLHDDAIRVSVVETKGLPFTSKNGRCFGMIPFPAKRIKQQTHKDYYLWKKKFIFDLLLDFDKQGRELFPRIRWLLFMGGGK